ncbi:MAG: hypothetical protein PWR11_644 [Bacillota bacterium]|nr:hypothetical protein [Bacillota bacterium]
MSLTPEELTPEAAREDAEFFLTSWAVLIREMYLDLAEPFRDFLHLVYEDMPPKEFLVRFLAAAGLAEHPEILPPAPSPERFTDPKERDAFRMFYRLDAFVPVVFDSLYRYATGGKSSEEQLEVFEKILHNFLYLSGPAFVFRMGKKADRAEVEYKLLSDKVSPRFAFAVRLYRARREFERALLWSLLSGNPKLVPISAPSLALLSGLSYTYIIKLIKTGKLSAWKTDGSWRISAIDAVRFLEAREDTPKWLRQVIVEIASTSAAAKTREETRKGKDELDKPEEKA